MLFNPAYVKSLRRAIRAQNKSLDRNAEARRLLGDVQQEMIDLLVRLGQRLNDPTVARVYSKLNDLAVAMNDVHGLPDIPHATKVGSRFIQLINQTEEGGTSWLSPYQTARLQRQLDQLRELLRLSQGDLQRAADFARQILHRQDWNECPILADMLEEAGYGDRNVLDALHRPNEYANNHLTHVLRRIGGGR